jgi:peptidoglycan/xylan/chitin deacetylase (PgdA/CDA1 family)
VGFLSPAKLRWTTCLLVGGLLASNTAIAATQPSANAINSKTKSKPPPPVPGVVYHGARTDKRVALTFDACSLKKGDHVDQGVLDTLEHLQVPATLFLGGKWMEDDADVVSKLSQNPSFELGSHSYLHPHFLKMKDQAIEEEVSKSQADFEKLVGHKATLFRTPYAEIDARVANLLIKDGLTPVQYDLASGDPDKNFDKKRLTKYVLKHVQPGSIVVMHINGHGWHTAEALPDIVTSLRAQGYELVRVSDLISPPAAANPAAPTPTAPSTAPSPSAPTPGAGAPAPAPTTTPTTPSQPQAH